MVSHSNNFVAIYFMVVADNLASDMEEDEIDEELALPPLLANLKFTEKRELLRFKRKHNEVEHF